MIFFCLGFYGAVPRRCKTHYSQLSNREGVVNRATVNTTTHALLIRYPYLVDKISVSSELISRIGFKKRRKTLSALDIPDSSRKEIEYVFVQNIVDTVERYKILLSLILNLDQTPLKCVPVGNEIALSIIIEGSSDKCCITGTFAITTHRKFLPMHLIYKGKTVQSFPKFKFSLGFCLSANEKQFSYR